MPRHKERSGNQGGEVFLEMGTSTGGPANLTYRMSRGGSLLRTADAAGDGASSSSGPVQFSWDAPPELLAAEVGPLAGAGDQRTRHAQRLRRQRSPSRSRSSSDSDSPRGQCSGRAQRSGRALGRRARSRSRSSSRTSEISSSGSSSSIVEDAFLDSPSKLNVRVRRASFTPDVLAASPKVGSMAAATLPPKLPGFAAHSRRHSAEEHETLKLAALAADGDGSEPMAAEEGELVRAVASAPPPAAARGRASRRPSPLCGPQPGP